MWLPPPRPVCRELDTGGEVSIHRGYQGTTKTCFEKCGFSGERRHTGRVNRGCWRGATRLSCHLEVGLGVLCVPHTCRLGDRWGGRGAGPWDTHGTPPLSEPQMGDRKVRPPCRLVVCRTGWGGGDRGTSGDGPCVIEKKRGPPSEDPGPQRGGSRVLVPGTDPLRQLRDREG